MELQIRTTSPTTSSVFIGDETWNELASFLQNPAFSEIRPVLLADTNTGKLCLPLLFSEIPSLRDAVILKFTPGEHSKSLDTANFLLQSLLDANTGRNNLLINLGGGVVSDIGGFVASIFKRGIQYINIPTSLIAMCDAAVGGKTSVNLGSVKNQAGTFCLPAATFVLPEFLLTLDKQELLSGLAEIIKIALVADESLWGKILSLPAAPEEISYPGTIPWQNLITGSLKIKCRIVENDLYDHGDRALLNFGHTFGHAFETLSYSRGYHPITHGHAVAMGMLCESFLSVQFSGLSPDDGALIRKRILSLFGYFNVNSSSIPELLDLLQKDKKNEGNTIRFALLEKPGCGVISPAVTRQGTLDALGSYLGIPQNPEQ